MRNSHSKSATAAFVTGLLLLGLGVGTAAFFYRMFPLEEAERSAPPSSDYDSAAMIAAVQPDKVGLEQDALLDLGSRFMGQPGVYRVENLIRDRYTAAGLEVYEQENYCAVPRSERREILGTDGAPLPDVEIYPFLPNYLQPMNTPQDGLTGTLLILDEEVLQERTRFSDCIGVIDAREDRVPEQLGFLWSRYAKLGLKALVVAHPDGLGSMSWERIAGGSECMVSSLPVNFVRVAASPGIFQYAGRKVTLHVRTKYENIRHTTLFGIMRASGNSSKSAMVLSCDYDACSPLPDIAMGGVQSLSPALHLRLLDGMLPYRDQLRRDVIFVSYGGQFMSHDGKQNLVRVLGANSGGLADNQNPVLRALGRQDDSAGSVDVQSPSKKYNQIEAEDNARSLALLDEVAGVLSLPGFFADATVTTEGRDSLSEAARVFFEDQILYVLNALILEISEPALQTKIAFERDGKGDIQSAEFKAYQEAKSRYEKAMAVAGYNFGKVIANKQEFLTEYGVASLWRERFAELHRHHRQYAKKLEQDRALIDLFGVYSEKVFVHPYLAPARGGDVSGDEELSFLSGTDGDTQSKSFNELLVWAQQKLGDIGSGLKVFPFDKTLNRENESQIRGTPQHFIRSFADSAGYAFFAPINRNRGQSYARYAYPVVQDFMRDTKSLAKSCRALGEVVLTLGMGSRAETFSGRPGRIGNDSSQANLGGRVLVSNVGQSMVPSFPLKSALITGARTPMSTMVAGSYQHPFYFTDPYGRYDLPYHVFGFAITYGPGAYSPVAVGFGADGVISYMKDEGPSGQRLFKSAGISTWVTEIVRNVTIVTFRATPVTLLDLMNPQTMREYSGVELVEKHGLSPLEKICLFPVAGVKEGIQTTFISPEETVFIKLLSGTSENEFANETRGFMLNITDEFRADPEKEIDGEGFLAQSSPLLYRIPFDTARSMSFLNGKRLDLQKRYNMTDERTEAYHEKSLVLTAESESGDLPLAEAARKSRESITYSTLNHPVLRESIFEAVLGILWYLGLLVPFVFFFEKLVFGFTDIRKQLLAQGVVFIIVFALLNILHPAFAMVRSSLIILLGFVIMIISGGVTIMSSGKFHENLEELRKKSGKVKAADINAMSAVSSAFMLGLNNMHRRKLRTGLTCATLVLMTFVMICFTSVQSDIVDEQITLGKALYQGVLVKKERFRSMTGGELFALNEEYGHTFDICPRAFLVGSIDWENNYENPSVEAVYTTDAGVTKRYEFKSAMTFSDRDPVRDLLRFRGKRVWFTENECRPADEAPPVIIPDAVADELGLGMQDIESGRVQLVINSDTFTVKGVFEAESLAQLQDLDGQDLLPFDIDSLDTVQLDLGAGQVLADQDAPRIPAERVILFPSGRVPDSFQGLFSRLIVSSIAVSMPKLSYRDARAEINAYMERSARSVYYGLDGMAYQGKRTRESSMEGLIDMLIPLIIAALVVLNTIRGSVYERRDEIYVYNAVGIAPRYVFFMFFAEAIVYAVVGAVMGYILSQGVGRILTELNMTGGMNMTFTSLTTIYASLAIAGATFISTFFPARTAMEIATPAEDAGWNLPEPDGDVLSFNLPFTFTHRDRIAVLAFFNRYLHDHGEGSSGRFFAGPPEIGLQDKLDPLADNAYIPKIENTIWLKPYDLSVSQKMIISLPTDSETMEYVAHIELIRLSGTKESWVRLNQGFVAQVRKHFLHWRAVSDEDRAEMFVEAKELLETSLTETSGRQA